MNKNSKQQRTNKQVELKDITRKESIENSDSGYIALEDIKEFIASGLYEVFLGEHASKAELSKEKGAYKGVESKYLKDAEPLNIKNTEELKNIEGFEEVIAAYLIMGDYNFDPKNIMVNSEKLGDKKIFRAGKINHNKSFSNFQNSPAEIIQELNSKFKIWGLNKVIGEDKLKFDIAKLNTAISKMLSQISTQQINDIFDKKIKALEKSIGKANNKLDIPKLEEYRGNLIKNLEIMKDLQIQLSIMEGLNKDNWLENPNKYTSKDDILTVLNNNFKIAEEDPIIWCIKNNYNIQGIHPVAWCLKNVHNIRNKKPLDYIKAHPEAQIPILENILDRYLNTPDNNEKNNLATIYNDIVSAINEKPIQLHGNEFQYNKVFQSSPDILARKIKSLQVTQGHNKQDPSKFAGAILKSCDIESVVKLCEIGKEIEKDNKPTRYHHLNSFIEAISDLIASMFNDKITTKNVEAAFKNVFEELSNAPSHASQTYSTNKPLKAFAEKISQQDKNNSLAK